MTARDDISGAPDPAEGVWPSWRARVWADLSPRSWVPGQAGIKAPVYDPPGWLDQPSASTEASVTLAKELFEIAEARAEYSETRGGKVAQSCLGLLAIAFTATGFLAARLRILEVEWWLWLLLVPAGTAIVALSLAGLQAMDAEHRVKLSFPPLLDDVAQTDDPKQRRVLVEEYDRAAQLADWCSNKRLGELLQARAWLTRGIIALTLTGIAVVGAWAVATPPVDDAAQPQNTQDHHGPRHPERDHD